MAPRVLLVLVPALLLPILGPPRPAQADAGWQWPVPAPHQVLHGFAPPGHVWLPGHRGVDLAAGAGAPVRSAGAGTVAFAGRIAGVGVVAVAHADGLETTYEPVRAGVHRGARVAAGAVLGRLLPAGSHCAPVACLHWGLRRGADYLDPLSLVGAARVRLLPMLTASGASWVAPAAGGASAGSSAVAVGWAVTVARRRRRRLPPEVASLAAARAVRAGRFHGENAG